MKKLSTLFIVVLMGVLASCSSGKSKKITPTATEFVSGELSSLVEVVDEPCDLSYAEKDGAIASQFIKLKVKLRLKKEISKFKDVDAQNIDFVSLLSVAIVTLVDEEETKVTELNVKDEDRLKLKKLLQADEGTEEIITFDAEFHSSTNAPKWFDQTAAFTPYLTADVITRNSSSNYNSMISNDDTDETNNLSSSDDTTSETADADDDLNIPIDGADDINKLIEEIDIAVNTVIKLEKEFSDSYSESCRIKLKNATKKMNNLSEKMDKVRDQLTESQFDRYSLILEKYQKHLFGDNTNTDDE